MGGTVAVFLRDPQGVIYNTLRWTNIFPNAVLQKDFLEAKQEAIDEFLQDWLMMKKDWDDNHTTRQFQYSITPEYAPYPAPFAPYDYGFILIDFLSKTLIGSQNYTSFTRISAADMFIPQAHESEEDYTPIWERYLQVQAMNGLQSFYTSKETVQELNADVIGMNGQNLYEISFPKTIFSIEEKIAHARQYGKNRHTDRQTEIGIFAITPPNEWVFKDLNSRLDAQGVDELMAFLASINWPITPSEERAFYQFYQDEDS